MVLMYDAELQSALLSLSATIFLVID